MILMVHIKDSGFIFFLAGSLPFFLSAIQVAIGAVIILLFQMTMAD